MAHEVLALTTESHAGEMGKRVPMLMTIPDTEEMLLPQLGVVPLQLLELLHCAGAWLRHRQAPESGQERHGGVGSLSRFSCGKPKKSTKTCGTVYRRFFISLPHTFSPWGRSG